MNTSSVKSSLFFVMMAFCSISEEGSSVEMRGEGEVEDLCDVTWAHAVNSRSDLEKALLGSINFLEADVSMGYLSDDRSIAPIPIMAHPPNNTSDISLEEWLDKVIESKSGNGVKLDFKSLDVVEPSLQILQARSLELNFTLWLNADILQGPIKPTSIPLQPKSFLNLCNKYFPSATLSVGWTTDWIPSFPFHWHYEWRHVRKMAEVIKCFGYADHLPKFTFPVRGIYAYKSIKQLRWLLGVIPKSTLTIWTSPQDPLLLEDLIRMRTSFPKNKVYYDIPDQIQTKFLKVKNKVTYNLNQQSFLKDDQWMPLTHGSSHACNSSTYISNNSIVFGSSLTTAVLLKKLLFISDKHSLKATGKINFFSDNDQLGHGTHELSIVVTDVSLFSKNSSMTGQDSIDLSGSDTDVLWEAINASHLYTFEHKFSNPSTNCRTFRLDTSLDPSFQAWTVQCEDMNELDSFSDIIKDGIAEVSPRTRLLLPEGPFMIGFVSSGEGHVVMYDFEIDSKEEGVSNAQSLSAMSIKSISIIIFSLTVGYVLKKYLH